MFAMQYSHRLPAGHDLQAIRQRAAAKGPDWDARPGLIAKAFVLQEQGRHGAEGNLYASVYLWHEPGEAASFLAGDAFQSVIDSFGRPNIETWLPLLARRGPAFAQPARALYREELPLPGTGAAALRDGALAAGEALLGREDVLAVWVAADLQRWRLLRFSVSAGALELRADSVGYEVLYLARPGLERLP
ncbi:DUF4865 family protein [Pseudomonas citronellolis]|uniref:DUF4865 family protein n=1 Tax=Pseudomonas citronellolis TaxID=53408 RepID=UPI0023E41A69|nr:DUF4865 family protein [Pseudomonas citronellolis]MDF3934263.1 DUF4865 family protein [Pseudomonas citronellolis]